jgi:hypothetical protein
MFTMSSTGRVELSQHPLGSVMIIVQDFNCSPVARSFHSSHSPAAVSRGAPPAAVKYHGCFPSASPAIHNSPTSG